MDVDSGWNLRQHHAYLQKTGRSEPGLPDEGTFPETADEIAIDRMYADNNSLAVGDTITVGGKELKITGLVALSDYSALFSDPGDLMFDSVKFGVSVLTPEGFAAFSDTHMKYCYSWLYEKEPADDTEEKEMADDFLEVLTAKADISGYLPRYPESGHPFHRG